MYLLRSCGNESGVCSTGHGGRNRTFSALNAGLSVRLAGSLRRSPTAAPPTG